MGLEGSLGRFTKKINRGVIDWKFISDADSLEGGVLVGEILVAREFVELYEDEEDVPRGASAFVIRDTTHNVIQNPMYAKKIMFFKELKYANGFAEYLKSSVKDVEYKVNSL